MTTLCKRCLLREAFPADYEKYVKSLLIRIPAAANDFKRVELRSPDPGTNPYLAYSMLIYACLYGIEHRLELPAPADINLYTASAAELSEYRQLPATKKEAADLCKNSGFVHSYLPESLIRDYCSI